LIDWVYFLLVFYSNFDPRRTALFLSYTTCKYALILKPGLGGHSRSSEPSRIDPPPMTSY